MTETALMASPAGHDALTLVRPIATPKELLRFQADMTELIRDALVEGLHYGKIPGAGDKKELLKPGAERINSAFGAVPRHEIVEKEIDHFRELAWTKRQKRYRNKTPDDKHFEWVTEDGVSFGIYRYVMRCQIVRGERVLGESIGACSTLESKYIDRPRDCENTVLKMASKRAYVGATIQAYGLSGQFQVERRKQGASGGYENSAEDRRRLEAALTDAKVPPELWDRVAERMQGKTLKDLPGVIESCT